MVGANDERAKDHQAVAAIGLDWMNNVSAAMPMTSDALNGAIAALSQGPKQCRVRQPANGITNTAEHGADGARDGEWLASHCAWRGDCFLQSPTAALSGIGFGARGGMCSQGRPLNQIRLRDDFPRLERRWLALARSERLHDFSEETKRTADKLPRV